MLTELAWSVRGTPALPVGLRYVRWWLSSKGVVVLFLIAAACTTACAIITSLRHSASFFCTACRNDRRTKKDNQLSQMDPRDAQPHACRTVHAGSGVLQKNGGGYTQRGVAKGLNVPCLFVITEVSIRCQKTRRLVYGVYPPIHHCMPIFWRYLKFLTLP